MFYFDTGYVTFNGYIFLSLQVANVFYNTKHYGGKSFPGIPPRHKPKLHMLKRHDPTEEENHRRVRMLSPCILRCSFTLQQLENETLLFHLEACLFCSTVTSHNIFLRMYFHLLTQYIGFLHSIHHFIEVKCLLRL